MSKRRSRLHWNTVEQTQAIGSAMAIATTARLLLGLRWSELGNQYTEFMVEKREIDKDLCDGGTKYILVPMLPFAVELCLKSLKSQGENGFIKTHDLEILWNDLSEIERSSIGNKTELSIHKMHKEERKQAYRTTAIIRTIDEIIRAHRNDFVDWRYVADGVRRLQKEKESIVLNEAFMDLVRIVNACVEYHKEREGQAS